MKDRKKVSGMDKGERVGDEVPEADKLVRAFLVGGGHYAPPKGMKVLLGRQKKVLFLCIKHI